MWVIWLASCGLEIADPDADNAHPGRRGVVISEGLAENFGYRVVPDWLGEHLDCSTTLEVSHHWNLGQQVVGMAQCWALA